MPVRPQLVQAFGIEPATLAIFREVELALVVVLTLPARTRMLMMRRIKQRLDVLVPGDLGELGHVDEFRNPPAGIGPRLRGRVLVAVTAAAAASPAASNPSAASVGMIPRAPSALRNASDAATRPVHHSSSGSGSGLPSSRPAMAASTLARPASSSMPFGNPFSSGSSLRVPLGMFLYVERRLRNVEADVEAPLVVAGDVRPADAGERGGQRREITPFRLVQAPRRPQEPEGRVPLARVPVPREILDHRQLLHAPRRLERRDARAAGSTCRSRSGRPTP